MLSILHRYVLREFIKGFVMSFAALIAVMLLGALYKPLRHGVGLVDLLSFLPFIIPYSIAWVLPAALLTATVMTYGRLSAENELTAVCASGIPLRYMCYPALLVAIVLTAAAIPVNDRLIPYCRRKKESQLRRILAEQPFKFRALGGEETIEFGDYKLFVESINGNVLSNVIVIAPLSDEDIPTRHGSPANAKEHPGTAAGADPEEETSEVRVFRARQAEYSVNEVEHTIHIRLKDAQYTIVTPDRIALQWLKIRADEHVMTIQTLDEDDASRLEKRANASTRDLLGRIVAYRQELAEATSRKDKARLRRRITHTRTEIHRREALSFSAFGLCLVGLPLGIWVRRESRLASFAIAVFVFLLHYALLIGGEGLAMEQKVAPRLAVWTPAILTSALGLGMLLHTFRR